MAAKSGNGTGDQNNHEMGSNTRENERDESPNSNLRNFVDSNYQQQKNEGKMDATDDIDDERASNFYRRALQESSRMCKEVEKSDDKMSKLREEFGEEMINSWRTEHASEVLLPEEAKLVELAHPQ